MLFLGEIIRFLANNGTFPIKALYYDVNWH